jgi:hypothetical protein
MPEPPPRPVRPSFAEEVRRPAPAPPERRSEPSRGDPLAGFAAEPPGGRPEPRPESMPPRITRTEPLMPRPQRSSEPPKAPKAAPPPPPVRAPERAAAPPPPVPSNADQNLADMAQRLEAALRRPATGEPMAPPVAPEPPPLRPSRAETPPPPPRSGFENLEDEMASLLGRPKPSS